MEKFNYLRCFLEGDRLHAIARFSLTNDNYKEAQKLLQNRYGNTQQIIATQMNALIKMSSVDDEDLSGLRKFFDNVISHGRSLVNLGAESLTYGSSLCPVILEKLRNELRLIIIRNNNENNWNSTKIFDLISVEIKDHKPCILPSHTAAEGKNDFGFSSSSHTSYTGSSLVSGSSSVHRESRKFKKEVVKATHWRVVAGNVFFCDGDHWSDKCLSNCLKFTGWERFVEKRKPLFHVSEN